jgi:hypothetical protein
MVVVIESMGSRERGSDFNLKDKVVSDLDSSKSNIVQSGFDGRIENLPQPPDCFVVRCSGDWRQVICGTIFFGDPIEDRTAAAVRKRANVLKEFMPAAIV